MQARCDYPRQSRLRTSADISAVFRHGKRARGRLMDVFEASSHRSEPRATVVVAKGGHGIVERNKVRRRLREIVRKNWLPSQRQAGAGTDLIVRARSAAYGASSADLAADFESCTRERGL